VIRALRQDAKKVERARKHLAQEAERRRKKREKGKWGDVVWSYLDCTTQAVFAGLGREAIAQLDQLITECRATPGARFDGILTSYKRFGTMGGILPEIERLRRFYAGYFDFVARNLSSPELRYAEDVFLAPVSDPNAAVKRGTNLLVATQQVTSLAFALGGTLAIRRGRAQIYAYQHPVKCVDQGGGTPKTLSFSDAEIEPIVMSWEPQDVTLPGWFPSRLPDVPVVRIGTPDALLDMMAVEKEELTATAGLVAEGSANLPPRLGLKVSRSELYGGLESDKWIRQPQQRLMQALWEFKSGA
jgi:hypothetical protein